MLKVGITGQAGFIGTHLYNTLGLSEDEFERVEFRRSYFDNESDLDSFVRNCDVIVHLAGMNRSSNPQVIYDTNVRLVERLIDSLERAETKPYIIFSSSTQESLDNAYGRSKKVGRELLEKWSIKNGSTITGLIIPNVFGPFGIPFYNSVVATFCHQLSVGITPTVENDSMLDLIYVSELTGLILDLIRSEFKEYKVKIDATYSLHVSELLKLLSEFSNSYIHNGVIPKLDSTFQLNLFNTFRCYIDIKSFFPRKLIQNKDSRGQFVEIAKLECGGQFSFSITHPNIVRGNHFHTRKIERFVVIKGRAVIELRKVGTNEVISYEVDGECPSYIDIPIWYTHNIKNVGTSELYTNFWINEFFSPDDPDTYFEDVNVS